MIRAPDRFAGSVRVIASNVIVGVSGEIDVATAPVFRALLDGAVAAGSPRVTVDLAGVTFMDARGLSALVVAEEALRQAGGRLTTRSVPEPVYRMLELTGLTTAFAAERAAMTESLVDALTGVTAVPLARDVLDMALKLVVTMAQAVVSGADGVSITLPRYGHFGTAAASNDVVLEMDHDQYDTGQGPCLDAATLGESFHSSALREELRWPAFVPRARARGIEAILSTPLLTDGQSVGALNIYSRTPDAFAEHEREWAAQFATEAAAVVSGARPGPGTHVLSEQIEVALKSRETIAVAQGVVMERDGVSAFDAYIGLRNISRKTGVPLRDVCDELVRPPRGTTSHRDSADGSAHDRTTE